MKKGQIPFLWTDARKQELQRLTRLGWTSERIGAAIGASAYAVKNARQRFGLRLRDIVDAPIVRPVASYAAPDGPTLADVYAPEASAEETDDDFTARYLGMATRSVERAEAQRHARIRIASDRPITITLCSDAHVSPHGTDMASLLQYADFVGATPDVYALGMGDWLDNPIKHKGGNVGQIADDLRMLDILVGRFRGKLLGTTSGNHDDWSKVLAGTDHLATLAKRHRIHYAPDELLWVVEIVNPHDADEVTATYRIHTRHQWRRGSALNPGHACWTWWQEEGPNWSHIPDVLAIGHNHVSVVESRQYQARDMWALRPGTFQIDSSFARAKGFGRYRATTPAVVLPPRQGRVVCFADPEDGVRFALGERAAA